VPASWRLSTGVVAWHFVQPAATLLRGSPRAQRLRLLGRSGVRECVRACMRAFSVQASELLNLVTLCSHDAGSSNALPQSVYVYVCVHFSTTAFEVIDCETKALRALVCSAESQMRLFVFHKLSAAHPGRPSLLRFDRRRLFPGRCCLFILLLRPLAVKGGRSPRPSDGGWVVSWLYPAALKLVYAIYALDALKVKQINRAQRTKR